MLCFALASAAIGGPCACEQRFSATPPLPADSVNASSPGALDDLLRQHVADAASPAHASHAMRISSCASMPEECPTAEPDASPDAVYHVVFGSGRGVVRSREQAMTDLYREMRDRLDANERLAVQVRPPGDAGANAAWHGRSTTPSTPSSDALAQAAMRLLDALDGAGELLIDVIHNARSDCLVSLAQSSSDGGAAQCLIHEPEHERGRGRGGLSF